MQLPAKLSRYAAVATLLLKHRSAMDDQRGDDAEQLAKPFPFADVERIVEAELGVKISKAYGLFEREPLRPRRSGKCMRQRFAMDAWSAPGAMLAVQIINHDRRGTQAESFWNTRLFYARRRKINPCPAGSSSPERSSWSPPPRWRSGGSTTSATAASAAASR